MNLFSLKLPKLVTLSLTCWIAAMFIGYRFFMQNEKMKYHKEYLDSIKVLEEKWKTHQQPPKRQVNF